MEKDIATLIAKYYFNECVYGEMACSKCIIASLCKNCPSQDETGEPNFEERLFMAYEKETDEMKTSIKELLDIL